MKKKILASTFILCTIVVCVYWYLGEPKENENFTSYRHKFSKKEKLALKKARLNEMDEHTENQKILSRKLANTNIEKASEDQSVSIAHPNIKVDDLKREYSLRGRENLRSLSRSPNSKIVYGDGKGNQYRLLKDYFAIKKTSDNEDTYGRFQERLGYFIIPASEAPANALRVMENAETGIPAIFTGLIKVKLTSNELSHNVLRNTNYQIAYQYDHINLVMYQFDSFSETIDAKKILDKNPNVIRATIELLEYERIEQ